MDDSRQVRERERANRAERRDASCRLAFGFCICEKEIQPVVAAAAAAGQQ